MSFLFWLPLVLFIFVCFFMILLILIQKGRGGGLASAFGGAGGNTAFGSKTGDVLTWATSIVFGIFLLLAIALNLLTKPRGAQAGRPVDAPAPAAQTTTDPPNPGVTAPGEALPGDTAPGGAPPPDAGAIDPSRPE